MDYNTINVFTNIEKSFNIAGSLPIVSLFSGALRLLAGKTQAIAGVVLSSIGLLELLFTENRTGSYLTNLGAEFCIHGALNILRGFGEALLCATTLVGNILLIIPNMSKEDMFGPCYRYGTLANRANYVAIPI